MRTKTSSEFIIALDSNSDTDISPCFDSQRGDAHHMFDELLQSGEGTYIKKR